MRRVVFRGTKLQSLLRSERSTNLVLRGFEALLVEIYLFLFSNYRNPHGGLVYFTFDARCTTRK